MKFTPPFTADRPFVPYFLIVSAIFLVWCVIGFVTPAPARHELLQGFESYVDQFREMSGGAIFWYIFIHNVLASLLMVGTGLLFGIVPIVGICFNGFALGVVYREGAETFGYASAALKVLPHGLFEIPAFVFAAAYGMWLGAMVIRRFRKKEEDPRLRFCVEHAFRRYFAVVFPLLVIAAGIETFLMLKGG